MTEREEANPYASPIAVCESVPGTWHFLDHHQGHLFVGLLGLGFGGPCLPGLLGMTLVAMGTVAMAAWFTLNCLGRATAEAISIGQGGEGSAEPGRALSAGVLQDGVVDRGCEK